MSNPEVVAAAKQRWGLDRSLPRAVPDLYGQAPQRRLGTSFTTTRAGPQDLLYRLPATLELVIAAMIIGTRSGSRSAYLRPISETAGSITRAGCSPSFGSSVPVFWPGLGLLFVFSVNSARLPGRAASIPRFRCRPRDRLHHPRHSVWSRGMSGCSSTRSGTSSCPPSCSGWAVTGTISRLVRANMLEVLDSASTS